MISSEKHAMDDNVDWVVPPPPHSTANSGKIIWRRDPDESFSDWTV